MVEYITEHFTVVCLVAWLLCESEGGLDHVLIDTPVPFLRKFQHENSISSIRKAGRFLSTPASLSFKGQATKHNCKMLYSEKKKNVLIVGAF